MHDVRRATWRDWTPGTRVVVRRLRDDLPAGAPTGTLHGGEPPFTDVLGDVLAVDDAGLTVRTRRGDVHVPAAAVVRAKTVPPAPPRRAPRAAAPGGADARHEVGADARRDDGHDHGRADDDGPDRSA